MAKKSIFCEQNYKRIKNPDGTACSKALIKIRIPNCPLLPCMGSDGPLDSARAHNALPLKQCEGSQCPLELP